MPSVNPVLWIINIGFTFVEKSDGQETKTYTQERDVFTGI